jgi:hypothetical protein
MTIELFRPGRPKKDDKLTPAQKQAAYRQRSAERAQDQQKSADFKKHYEYQIDYEIAEALENYQLAVGDDREANFHALNALKRFKSVIESKEQYGWKQDEL